MGWLDYLAVLVWLTGGFLPIVLRRDRTAPLSAPAVASVVLSSLFVWFVALGPVFCVSGTLNVSGIGGGHLVYLGFTLGAAAELVASILRKHNRPCAFWRVLALVGTGAVCVGAVALALELVL
jgi:hypothetical protein